MLELDTLDVGMRMRVLRVAAGLSQHMLAARAGVDRRRISELERGERTPSSEELKRIYSVLAEPAPIQVPDYAVA